MQYVILLHRGLHPNLILLMCNDDKNSVLANAASNLDYIIKYLMLNNTLMVLFYLSDYIILT